MTPPVKHREDELDLREVTVSLYERIIYPIQHFVDTMVGVAQMVAVTVILAVITETFVLGIGDDVEVDQKPVFGEDTWDMTDWEFTRGRDDEIESEPG